MKPQLESNCPLIQEHESKCDAMRDNLYGETEHTQALLYLTKPREYKKGGAIATPTWILFCGNVPRPRSVRPSSVGGDHILKGNSPTEIPRSEKTK